MSEPHNEYVTATERGLCDRIGCGPAHGGDCPPRREELSRVPTPQRKRRTRHVSNPADWEPEFVDFRGERWFVALADLDESAFGRHYHLTLTPADSLPPANVNTEATDG